MALLARMIRRHHVLETVLDPLDRPPEAHTRDADQEVLGVKLAAYAESAAHMALVKLHRRHRPIEETRERLSIAVRHLRRAPQLDDVIGRVVTPERAAAFQRHAGMAADREVRLNDTVRGAEARIDVAEFLAQHQRLCAHAWRKLAGRRQASRRTGSSSRSSATSSAASSASAAVSANTAATGSPT